VIFSTSLPIRPCLGTALFWALTRRVVVGSWRWGRYVVPKRR